jgi:DivIVA domain-containing protein
LERVRKTDFPVGLRGYDRAAVDKYVAEVAQVVAELEATQTREGVVQRALDEVGEQTSGILQHAHDTAEEIAARSRSQAEGRLQRAEKEADDTRREADRYAERVVTDTRRLWQERQRLIEDMRQLADEVLRVADDALERLEQPDAGFGRPGAAAAALDEPAAPWELPAPEPEADPAPDAQAPDQPEAQPEPTLEQPRDDLDTTSELQAPAARERSD